MGKKARIVRLIALYMAQKSTAQYVEYSIESVKCLLNSRGGFLISFSCFHVNKSNNRCTRGARVKPTPEHE